MSRDLIFFDTHCHLQDERFDHDRDAVVARGGGLRMLVIGSDFDSSRRAIAVAERYENAFAAVGIHPTAPADFSRIDELEALAQSSSKVIAIGETGFDFHHSPFDADAQRQIYRRQIELAQKLRLPLILHARDAAPETLAEIAPFMQDGGKAAWHCYSAPKKQLAELTARALALNLYLGISGMITYEEQRTLREIIKTVPDRHLLLDTDAPYLLPRPRELDRNEPAQCRRIAEKLAEIRGVSLADMARITTRNACEFLNLDFAEPPALAYPIRDSLYVNLTARCNNHCVFCARNRSSTIKGHDLALPEEPSAEKIIAAIGEADGYREVVFCGLGEPTMRLEELKIAARHIKKIGKRSRLNTNGLANLQHGRDVTPELAGLIDAASISLNATSAEQYHELCQSDFGETAFAALQVFARACRRVQIDTTLTVVDMPEIDLAAAEKIAAACGAKFRVRGFIDAG